jgi:hypothetical protein
MGEVPNNRHWGVRANNSSEHLDFPVTTTESSQTPDFLPILTLSAGSPLAFFAWRFETLMISSKKLLADLKKQVSLLENNLRLCHKPIRMRCPRINEK